jgi:thiol:disulfide interchange protein DsbA
MMQRRNFFNNLGSVALTAAALSPNSLLAQTKAPQPDVDFKKLDKPAPIQAAVGKVEVLEFFWYNCPHCNAFEPTLATWVKQLPKDVAFNRIPIAFDDSFAPQQRLYYALEAMGLLDKLHTKVFAAIHVEKQNLSKGPAITDWIAKQGVDKAKFLEHFSSFTTTTKASRATQLQTAYRVEGVPALGVAGRFYTDGELAKTMDRVLQVVDFLTAEVRNGR